MKCTVFFFEFVRAQRDQSRLDLYMNKKMEHSERWREFYDKFTRTFHISKWFDVYDFTKLDACMYDLIIVSTGHNPYQVPFGGNGFGEKIGCIQTFEKFGNA